MDTYTKAVLTVIAVALSAIALKPSVNEVAHADVAGMDRFALYGDTDFRYAVEDVLGDTNWENIIRNSTRFQDGIKGVVSSDCFVKMNGKESVQPNCY